MFRRRSSVRTRQGVGDSFAPRIVYTGKPVSIENPPALHEFVQSLVAHLAEKSRWTRIVAASVLVLCK
jgi:hypothetical protein